MAAGCGPNRIETGGRPSTSPFPSPQPSLRPSPHRSTSTSGNRRLYRMLTSRGRERGALLEVAGLSEQTKAVHDLPHPDRRKSAQLTPQVPLVDSQDLSDVDHARFRQVALTFAKQDVARCAGAPRVGGQRANDRGVDWAAVE